MKVHKLLGMALTVEMSQSALASSYNCTIKQYISEQSQQTKDIVAPFLVEKNGKNDPIPAPFKKANELSWSVTRSGGLITAEVRDSKGQVLTISTSSDGRPLGVQVPSAKQILTCNPNIAEVAALKVDPTSYGESISFNKALEVNPMVYGSTIQLHIMSAKARESLQRLLDQAHIQNDK